MKTNRDLQMERRILIECLGEDDAGTSLCNVPQIIDDAIAELEHLTQTTAGNPEKGRMKTNDYHDFAVEA